jgi:Ser-tRNA(Ala) deacylase AlaX
VNRQNVSDLSNVLASSNQPLGDEQATALAATLLVERKRRTEEMRSRSYSTTDPRARLDLEEQNLRITEESQARAISAARSYLSEQQVILIKNSMSQRAQATRQSLMARRAQLDSGAGR